MKQTTIDRELISTMAKENPLPFMDYVRNEGWLNYPSARHTIDVRTNTEFIDIDDDFAIGHSGGFLMKMDFEIVDTHLFTKVADNYSRNKANPDIQSWVNSLQIPKTHNRNKYYYCPHPYGTPKYDQFWARETYRRRHGMTAKCKLLRTGEVVDLHITGDHYNYLNYGRIMRTPNKKEKEEQLAKGITKVDHISGFPRFWDGDYWNFKIDEFIARNNYHLAKGKARGKGYSFKRGSQAANTVNLYPNITVLLCAYDLKYLTDPGATTDMAKTNLDWYEDNTHWKRGYLSQNLEKIQLGVLTKSEGKKIGFLGRLLSFTTYNNESVGIGKRAIEIDYEEAGRAPNLEEFLDVTLSSTEVGAANVGTIRVYGTAGTKDANWAPFANVFYNPDKYKMMPFENIWDYDARHTTCGFFHPQVWNLEPFIDKDGNSMLDRAYEYDIYDKAVQSRVQEADKYFTYVGQRANTPEDAFRRGVENIFSSPELTEHAKKVIDHGLGQYYRDGMLIESKNGITFKTNSQLLDEGLKSFVHPYITDVPFLPKKDFFGCIREYAPPFKDENGNVPSGLYYAVLDPVAKDKKSSLVTAKNSLVSIQVYMFPNTASNTSGDILVAAYAGRPPSLEEADKIFLKILEYYNCRGLAETDRGNTVPHFKKWGKLNKLYRDPTIQLSNRDGKQTSAPYGINMGSGNNSIDSLEYYRDLLYEKRGVDGDGNIIYNFHYIYDVPLLKELLAFDISSNFDRISTGKLASIIRMAMQVKRRRDIVKQGKSIRNSIFQSIGLHGYK